MKKARRNILGNKVFKLALIFISLFLIGAFLLVKEKIGEVRAGEADNVAGWAWSSENFGWFSANCSNNPFGLFPFECPDIDGPPPYDYGLNVEDDGTVAGYLWAENIGWVRFGNPLGELAPGGAVARAIYDKVLGRITGWAKVLILGDEGWLKLRGPDAGMPGGPYSACADCQDVEIPGDPPTVDYQCNICFTGKFPDPSETGIGNICGQCSNCNEGTNTCNACTFCDKYGISVDRQNGRIVGWAWNGNNDPAIGVGWINFSPTPGGLGLASPWLETKYGDIYGKLGVKSPSAFVELINKYNATYCILSTGAITNFRSGEGCVRTPFENFDFPRTSNLYTNIFGKIDLTGILAGKYGLVNNINSGDDIPSLMAGKVYYKNGDLTVSAKIFNNGSGRLDGSGLIVVRGNLTITGDLSYQAGPSVLNLKNLASVGWLVLDDGSGLKGKIIINPSVEKLVGAFYAENEIATGTTNNRRTDKSLTVRGLMLAKKFNFQRLWQSAQRGSEQVIYDGRVLANTPPGMADLMSALPIWREAAP